MKNNLHLFALLSFFALASCGSKTDTTAADAAPPETIVPVTVANVAQGPMEEFIELNATSAFLQRWIVKANANGYLEGASLFVNKQVNAGQTLFTVKTKEAAAIGNTINKLDPSFHFSGVNVIRSAGRGYITELNHQAGDYVQDGEQLAVITDTKSFVFILNMPYEMRPFIKDAKSLQLTLPDDEQLMAVIRNDLPTVDSTSQTQRIVLKVNASHPIPENLIAKVKLVKRSNANAFFFPKSAVLTDETQTTFWVMKLLNDSTAVKTEIKKGMETPENIEVTEPVFKPEDKVLLNGNYGLADTAKVKIIKPSSSNE